MAGDLYSKYEIAHSPYYFEANLQKAFSEGLFHGLPTFCLPYNFFQNYLIYNDLFLKRR